MVSSSSSTAQAIVIAPNAPLVLEELVAATSRKALSSRPKTVDTGRESSRATSSERPTDSGYASAVNTPEKGTPENSVDGFSRPGEEYSLPSKLLRKPTKLTPFSEEISKSTLERFDDLAILFSEPLYKCASKGQSKHSPISMKCVVLGENISTAKPWIVVLCDISISKKVKKFFDQRWVKEECHPSDPKLPQFEHIIHNRAPRLIAGTSVGVYGSVNGQPHAHMTSCGRLIQVGSDEETRLATLGGIIKLQYDYGVQLLGLTAAHILISEEDNWNSDGTSEDDDLDDGDDEFSEADENEAYPNETYELDLGSENEQSNDDSRKSGPSIVELDAALSAVPTKPDNVWHKVGHLYAKSTESADSSANFDWALVELDDMRLIKPNLLIDIATDSTRKIALGLRELMIPSVNLGRGQPVEVLSGTNGLRHGCLSQSLSYLMSAGGRAFVQTYSLILSDGFGLNPGDCGSWVVDKETREVYGYVIASDIFKEAYIVPLHATFQDIQRQLGVQKVFLPSQIELEELSKLYNPVQSLKSQQPKVSISATAYGPSQTASNVSIIAQYTPKAAILVDKAETLLIPVPTSASKPENKIPPATAKVAITAPTPATTAQSEISKTRKLRDMFKRIFPSRSHNNPSKNSKPHREVVSFNAPLYHSPLTMAPQSLSTFEYAPLPYLVGSSSDLIWGATSLDLPALAQNPLYYPPASNFSQSASQPSDSGYSSLGGTPTPYVPSYSPCNEAYSQPTDSGYTSAHASPHQSY